MTRPAKRRPRRIADGFQAATIGPVPIVPSPVPDHPVNLRAAYCEACQGYSKMFYVERARIPEPLADDLASLGLDVLVGKGAFPESPIHSSSASWPGPTKTVDI